MPLWSEERKRKKKSTSANESRTTSNNVICMHTFELEKKNQIALIACTLYTWFIIFYFALYFVCVYNANYSNVDKAFLDFASHEKEEEKKSNKRIIVRDMIIWSMLLRKNHIVNCIDSIIKHKQFEIVCLLSNNRTYTWWRWNHQDEQKSN